MASSNLQLGRARLVSHPRLFSSTELVSVAVLLRQRGLSDNDLLQHGVTRADLSDPSRRISLHQALETLRLAHEIFDEDLSIVAGAQLHVSTYGIAGFALLSSATLMEALRCIQRYWPLFNLKYRLNIIECDDVVRVTMEDRFGVLRKEPEVFAMLEIAKLMTLCRDLAGPRCAPVRIGVSIDSEGLSLISRAEIVKSEVCFLDIPAAATHVPLAQANSAIHRNIVSMCDGLIDDLFKESLLVRRIKSHLTQLENGAPTSPEIAVKLCMSERTFRRRLREAGTSYKRLLDEVRMERAEQYLLDDSVTADLIAERLGYTEATNFLHAFKRWTGSTPRMFCPKMEA